MTDKKETEAFKGLDDDERADLQLESQDKTIFTIPRKAAFMSALIKTVATGDTEEDVIPLPNVTSSVLKEVVAFLIYHEGKPSVEIARPLTSATLEEVVSDPWDAHFVDVSQERLFELILAANYMDIKPLLDLACAKVASMIKGKTPEQIRQTFNIQNDFTPEEEEAVQQENRWAEES